MLTQVTFAIEKDGISYEIQFTPREEENGVNVSVRCVNSGRTMIGWKKLNPFKISALHAEKHLDEVIDFKGPYL